jgi:hypothetical protein
MFLSQSKVLGRTLFINVLHIKMHEFCPPVSELVQALVQLMQQASLSKHRSGDDFGMINQGIDRHETMEIFG